MGSNGTVSGTLARHFPAAAAQRDKDGNPVDQYTWVKLTLDPAYAVIVESKLYDLVVNTRWIGYGELPFETVVYLERDPNGNHFLKTYKRHDDLSAAKKEHELMVDAIRKTFE